MKLLAACVLLSIPLFAFAQEDPQSLTTAVRAADAAYWQAYNGCDYAALDSLTAENVEFYHDKGGITNGRAALTDSVRRYICGNFAQSVRREADAKDVEIHLLNAGPKVYGALITGSHRFFEVPKGAGAGGPGTLTGRALFTILWLRKGDGWELSRVFSYDHRPAS